MRRAVLLPGLALLAVACGPPNTPVTGGVAGSAIDVNRPVSSRDLEVTCRLKEGGLENKVHLTQVEPGQTLDVEVRVLVTSPSLLVPGRGVDVNTNGVTARLTFQRVGQASISLQEDAVSGVVGFDKIGAVVGAPIEAWYVLRFPSGQLEGRFATVVQK